MILAEFDEDVPASLDASLSRLEDSYWSAIAFGRYNPQRFLNWWIARRWIIPRDIRKEYLTHGTR